MFKPTATFMGRLTSSPAFRAGSDSSASSQKIKDQLPEYRKELDYIQFDIACQNMEGDTERVLYITCNVYGNLATQLNSQLYKGVKVLVSGTPFAFGNSYGVNLALALTDCEIVQHTKSYLSEHQKEIETQQRDDIDRVIKLYDEFIDTLDPTKPTNTISYPQYDRVKVSQPSELEVQGLAGKTTKGAKKSERGKGISWEEIEKELMGEGINEGFIVEEDYGVGRSFMSSRLKDIPETPEGFIDVDSLPESDLPFD